MPSDLNAQAARMHHEEAARYEAEAARHRQQRDVFIRRLRLDDPLAWTYAEIARQVGCSPELVAYICRGIRNVSEIDPGELL